MAVLWLQRPHQRNLSAAVHAPGMRAGPAARMRVRTERQRSTPIVLYGLPETRLQDGQARVLWMERNP